MEDLLFSLRTVFPLLVIMGSGYLARQLKWLDDRSTRQMNACVFRLFLPVLLFINVLDTSRNTSVDGGALAYALITTLLCFGIMFVIAAKTVPERRDRGVFIQGVSRSNYAIFGIPLVMMMYPDGDTAIAALMVAVVVPVFNVMGTIALMVYSDEHTSSPWEVVRGILVNPLIIGTALGFILWRLDVQLPELIDIPVRQLSRIATPLALFLLGASIDFGKARANRSLLLWSVLGKLLIVPFVFLGLAILLGIRDVSLAALIAVYASPVSVSSFPMAQQLGGNGDLAGGQVAFTTVLSGFTVFLWIYVLKALGYLG